MWVAWVFNLGNITLFCFIAVLTSSASPRHVVKVVKLSFLNL